MFFKRLLLTGLLLWGSCSFGQSFSNPLKIAPSLSGNYGELRATHFHSGIDLRIGGVSGAPVYAPADGYISRVTCSPTGYGNAIYITHPGGYVTVYGHLQSFAAPISSYIINKQYEKESFAIDEQFDATQFPVKRGDMIGRAGNTGSSGGPHLHFEIRRDNVPLNPLKNSSIKIIDKTPPTIDQIRIFAYREIEGIPVYYPISWIKGDSKGGLNGVTEVTDSFFIAVKATDYQKGNRSKFSVYNYRFYLDSTPIFSFTPDAIPFENGRYINSLVEYSAKVQERQSMVKSWVEPANALSVNLPNIVKKGDGLFILNDDNVHTIRVEAVDEHGNSAIKNVKVKRALPFSGIKDSVARADISRNSTMPWFINNFAERFGVRVIVPMGTLYRTISFTLDTAIVNGGVGYQIGDENIALNGSVLISVDSSRVKNCLPLRLFERYKDQIFLAQSSKDGDLNYSGGYWKEGRFEANIGRLGRYTFAVDTVPPKVIPSFSKGSDLRKRDSFTVTIKDDLSGIASYKVFIDNRWILASFDAKSNRLFVKLDRKYIKRGVTHSVEIIVKDGRNNVNTVKTRFLW